MPQEWQAVQESRSKQKTVYCAWCGRMMGIPMDTTLPITLKCHTCHRIFTLQIETDLLGRPIKTELQVKLPKEE